MSRQHRLQWLSYLSRQTITKSHRRHGWCAPTWRLLRSEPLEERRLLTITVDTLVDEADGSITDGDVSLRDAIGLAPSGETINFEVTGTISLILGELLIDKDLTVAGPGADMLTIDAHGRSRVFNVDDGQSSVNAEVTLSGLTIGYGVSLGNGGGIRTTETLMVVDSVITGNSTDPRSGIKGGWDGGGIWADGPLTIVGSTIRDNVAGAGKGYGESSDGGDGGGVWVNGPTTILTSTIANNRAGHGYPGLYYAGDGGNGGGIWAGDITTISSSTISGNSTGSGGDAYYPPDGRDGSGGGIWSKEALTITNSTVSGNTAGHRGGGVFNSMVDAIVVHHSTINDNNAISDAGIDGSALLYHTIVAGNHGGLNIAQSSIHEASAYNLIGGEPLLQPLADNGGPTATHALTPLSPAVSAGDPTFVRPPDFDQRGAPFDRLRGERIDIGAFELQDVFTDPDPVSPGAVLYVDIASDEVNGNYSAGDLSLREAVFVANVSPGAQRIEFAAAFHGIRIQIPLILGELKITDSVEIDATSLAELTISANGASRVFNVDDGHDDRSDVQLRGMSLIGGLADGPGGAIVSSENLTIEEVTISGNAAHGAGGGIYSTAVLHVFNSKIADNVARGNGGGISSTDELKIIQSWITGNRIVESASSGGGIWAIGMLLVDSSTVDKNRAGDGVEPCYQYGCRGENGGDGGGIWVDGVATISNSTISGNTTGSGAPGGGYPLGDPGDAGEGGGLDGRGTMTIVGSTVYGNRAGSSYSPPLGIGIRHYGLLTLHGSIVCENPPTSNGYSYGDILGTVDESSSYNLVGVQGFGGGITNGTNGNQIGTSDMPIDPQLGPLQRNGGPTWTHALLPDSPAIDKGDPAFAGPSLTDQRSYYRVAGGRIDIGAYEYASVAVLDGDGNADGVVDEGDYNLWVMHFGDAPTITPPGPPANGDYNGDGKVDGLDYLTWAANFGASVSAAPATEPSLTSTSDQLSAVDAALEDDYDAGATVADDSAVQEWQLSRAFDSVLKKRHSKRKDRT